MAGSLTSLNPILLIDKVEIIIRPASWGNEDDSVSYCAKALAQSLVLSVNGGDGVDGDVDRTEHKADSIETTVERRR